MTMTKFVCVADYVNIWWWGGDGGRAEVAFLL